MPLYFIKKIFIFLFHFWIRANLHIALGAGFLCYATRLTWNANATWSALENILICGVLISYNLDRILEHPKQTSRLQWIEKNQLVLKGIISLALFFGILFLFSMPLQAAGLLLLSGLFSLAYTLPCVRHNKKWLPLSHFFIIRLWLVATIWTVSTVIVPTYIDKISLGISLPIALHRFFFIAAITMPFEWRDRTKDHHKNIRTFATLFPEEKFWKYCYFFILIGILPIFLTQHPLQTSLIAFPCLMFIILLYLNKNRSETHLHLIIDGLFICHYPLIYLMDIILPSHT